MSRALLLIALTLSAQPPTPEQSVKLKTPGGAAISPDGRAVAWTVTEADFEQNDFVTQIWLAAGNSAPIQLTRGKKSSTNPVFTPDSKRLAFLSSRDGKSQVYLLPIAGGEAAAVTNDETGVNNFRISPDGLTVVYSSQGPEPKPLKDRKEKYGDFEVVREDYRYTHLYSNPLPADGEKPAKPTPLTSGEQYTVGGFSFAPDGRRIAFSATRSPELSQGHTADLYTLDLASKQITKLVTRDGSDVNPIWSPDGSQIAFLAGQQKPFDCCPNGRIAIVPAAGGTVKFLADSFDENPSLEAWGPQGIYFTGLQKTYSALFQLNPQSGAVSRVFGDAQLSPANVDFARDFKTWAYSAASANRAAEIYVSSGQPRKLSNFAAQYDGFKLSQREVVSWKSKDGAEIEGVLHKPADFDPKKKYPLLVVIHGGPTGIDRPVVSPDRYYPIEQFVAKGALVLRPNYRGSAGYGEKFRSLNVRNLGVGDAWDVLSGVDHLIAQGFVDPDKLGSMGWSQGGYISAFLTTSTTRFKAISVGAGISNWMTYYVNTDITQFTRNYLKATPWQDPEIYRKTSPISYVKDAKTPTLIQHGENDRRVPIPNAYELRQALEDVGVPVRMVVYKGFGHGITKPKQMQHVMEDNLRWFSQHIWGEAPR